MTALNRRAMVSAAFGGATAITAASTAPAKAHTPAAASVLPPGLFGPAPGVARLGLNENPYGPSPKVMAAVAEASKYGSYYAQPTYLAKMIAEKNGVTPEHVVLSAGSGEVLCAAALAFGKKGAILCPALFWDSTARYAERQGVVLKRIPMKGDMNVDLAALEAAVDSSIGMVQVCNPNNPTGIVIPAAELAAFTDRVSAKVPVLIDEAYNELTGNPEANSVMNLVRAGKNVIVARTFSKIYGMAGMRIGYMITTPENAKLINSYLMTSMAATSIAAAIVAYNDEAFLKFSKAKVVEGREMVFAAVKAAGLSHLPSETNFVFVKVPDAALLQKRMAERNIMIRGPYGSLTQWSRVSMGKIEDVERYAKALPQLLGA